MASAYFARIAEERLREAQREGTFDNLPGTGKPQALDDKARRLFGRSLKFRQVSAGGCNACEADVNVLNTVVFDLGRFGIQLTILDALLRLLGRLAEQRR